MFVYFFTLQQLTSCRVGAHCTNLQTPSTMDTSPATPSQSHSKLSPLKSFFTRSNSTSSSSSNTSSGGSVKSSSGIPGVDVCPSGLEDETFGKPIPICGQIGSVCLYHDAVSAAQVKTLYTAGPNNQTVYIDEADIADLPAKMVAYYNARVSEKFCNEKHVYTYLSLSIA